MSLEQFLKLVHVLAAIWFISGLVGRWVILAQAARSDDVRTTRALVDASGRFEERMVVPGSIIVLISGLLTAWATDLPLLGFFQGSSANWLLVSLILYLSAIPLVPLVFLPRGRRFAEVLDAAALRGAVTGELRAAFSDRVVVLGHIYEFAMVLLVLTLMVTKVI